MSKNINCTYCGGLSSDFHIQIFSKKCQNYCSFSCLNKSRMKGCEMCGKHIDFSRNNERIFIKDAQPQHYCTYSCLQSYLDQNRYTVRHF
jgi:hypothetical protein